MLADRELATIRAALAYWRDEMTPYGDEVQQPYFGDPCDSPLDPAEVERLRSRFAVHSVRYAVFVEPNLLKLISRDEAYRSGDRAVTVIARA